MEGSCGLSRCDGKGKEGDSVEFQADVRGDPVCGFDTDVARVSM